MRENKDATAANAAAEFNIGEIKMKNDVEKLTASFNKKCDTLFKSFSSAAARREEEATLRMASTDGRTRRSAQKFLNQASDFREKAAQSLRAKISIKRIS